MKDRVKTCADTIMQDKNNGKRDRAVLNVWEVVRDISSLGRLFQRMNEDIILEGGSSSKWNGD